jgi:hypothetical protein
MASPLNVTKIPAPRVAVIDPTTGLVSREWYRFFLNLFELTGSGSNAVSLDELQIGPPNQQFDLTSEINNLIPSGPSDSPLVSQIAELEKQVQASELSAEAATQQLQSQLMSLANEVQALAVQPPTTPNLKRRSYGSFYDLTDQTALLANTAYAITFGNTEYSNGVYIGSPTSRVYTDRYGFYNIQFSAQLDKTSASLGNVWIWLDKNGTTVANTATQVTLQGSSAASVAAWNFLLELNAGDYFRLMWSTDDTDCIIKHDPNAPPVPAIPSIILTVTDNINAYQD